MIIRRALLVLAGSAFAYLAVCALVALWTLIHMMADSNPGSWRISVGG